MDNLTPNQIKQMISLLQVMLENTDIKEDAAPTVDQAEKPTPNNVIKTLHKKPPVSHINKFDSMMESTMHKDDIEIDKKLNKYGPTPRTRAFKPITVQCRVCGKKETINPVLLTDSSERYKCNNCSRSAG
jgi:hypothetical protein